MRTLSLSSTQDPQDSRNHLHHPAGKRAGGRLRRPTALLLAAGLSLAAAPSLSASSLDKVSALERVQAADLIFEGEVVQVDYRSSEAGPGQISLPHTYVTYAIQHVFKGSSAAGQSLTLRMQGGPDDQGRFLKVSGVPQFRPGDRDILFVQDNGSAICPLVGWEQGRFRVIRDEVFNALGQEVWVTQAGGFAFGEVQVDTQQAGYPALPEAARSGEARAVFTPPAGAQRPDASGFSVVLDEMLLSAAAKGLLNRPLAPVASISPAQSFSVPAPLAGPAPADPLGAGAPLFEGEYDAREAELIRKARSSKN